MQKLFRHPITLAALVFLAYYLLGQAAIRMTIMPEGIAMFWPPNAVVVSALILSPVRRWALYVGAGMLAEGVADYGFYPNWQIVGFAFVNAAEALLTGAIVRWGILRAQAFGRLSVRKMLALSLTFLFVSAPIAALGGSAIYWLGDPDVAYWTFWRMWWFGDAIGLLVVAPLLLVWFGEAFPSLPQTPGRKLELAVLSCILLLGSSTIFFAPISWPDWTAAPSLLLPLLAWAGVRFGLHGATAATVFVAFMAAGGTTHNQGPFINAAGQAQTVLAVQEYLVVAATLALALGASVRELKRALADLDNERQMLETRVEDRTRELQQARTLAEQRALTDGLTGLKNRTAFFEALRTLDDQARRYERSYAVIMMDIDHFKTINDTYGHAAGDATLQAVAEIIQGVVRNADVAGRLGGEEFAICLPETTTHEALILAERLRKKIEETHLVVHGAPVLVRASFGVCAFNFADTSPDGTMLRADKALYHAKNHGRNCAVCFEDLPKPA